MKNHLREIRKRAGFTLEEAAEQLGTTHSTLSRIENGTRGLDAKWLSQFSALYRCSTDEILFGPKTVPLVGKVGAGDQVHLFEDDTSHEQIDWVEAPPDADQYTVAVIVEGDSMFPRYLNHETIYYRRSETGDPRSLIGREVVVRLADGRTFVKVLRRGSAPGYFTLHSYNAPPMEDVAIEWAVPVKWARRD